LSIDRAFRRSAPREDSPLELNLRPDNPFSHPLLGDLVPTNNMLLRVVKRKLKHPRPDDDGAQTVGEYTAVAVGVIPKTARFRSEQPFIAFVERYDATPHAEIMFYVFIRI
jgi:general transcription factor 3C polypeptide 5 (transcription factor C subunit 1)